MNDRKIIVFGAGAEGRKALLRIGEERIFYFVDNNVDLQGSYFHSKKVLSLEELLNILQTEDYRIIISSQKYYHDISNQLHDVGIDDATSISRFLVEDAFQNKENGHRILLMNTHAGINIGDQLITEGELIFFNKFLPDFSIIELPADIIYEELALIKEFTLEDDIIAISGGGYMGSLWMSYGEDNVRSIANAFPQNRIIIMPQSVFFEDSKEGEIEYRNSIDIYSKHSKLYFCAREKRTFDTVVKMLNKKDKTYLIPDMAILLSAAKTQERENVGICLRGDKEKILSESFCKQLSNYIESEVVTIDMLADNYIGIHNRKQIVSRMILQVSKLKYVITDRLHCMILCAITGTPCIAFDNLTGKVSGVYDWIKSNEYIHVLSDFDTVFDLIKKYENESTLYQYDNSDLFPQYEKLARIIDGSK